MYIKPVIVAIDETSYWEPELAQKAGKIYGIWIYDSNEIVHCCSFSGSYWLEPIDVVTINECDDETRDKIDESFDMYTEPTYYDERYIDNIPDKYKVVCPTYRCRKEDAEDMWESIVENYIANPRIPEAVLNEEIYYI